MIDQITVDHCKRDRQNFRKYPSTNTISLQVIDGVKKTDGIPFAPQNP